MNIQDDEIIKIGHFSWDKAKHFYYVAKGGSISSAAKLLNMLPSALSRRMSDLENDLRCQLFIRQSRGVELTGKGKEFLEIIGRTYQDLKSFNYNNTVMTHNGQKRRIKISTTHAVAAYILSEHIINYNKKCPEIYFDIISDDQLVDIIINDVDISIRPYDHNAVEINQCYIFALQKRLYASQSYIDKYGEPKTLDDLPYHHLMTHAQPDNHPYSDINWILKLGMPEGKMKQPVLTSNSLECLIEAAQQGIGIIGNYSQMKIIKNSGLINIVPSIMDEPVKWYISHPNYLTQDEQIDNFKRYMINQLN